jgi:hypothetical protein
MGMALQTFTSHFPAHALWPINCFPTKQRGSEDQEEQHPFPCRLAGRGTVSAAQVCSNLQPFVTKRVLCFSPYEAPYHTTL